MYTTLTSRYRAERLIAVGRVILAVVSLIAIYFDPTEPAHHAATAYTLLVLYVLFAIGTMGAAWSASTMIVRGGVAIHIADLVVYSLLVYFTRGPNSPFFTWFVFALFSAALRFGRRGVIWTSVVAIVVFNGVGVLSFVLEPGSGLELNRFLIRSSYLAVIAALLIYLAHYQAELQSDLLSLSAWPRFQSLELLEVVNDLFDRATGMLQTPRALLLIRRNGDSEWDEIAWDRGRVTETRRSSTEGEPAAEAGFISRDLSALSPEIVTRTGGKLLRARNSEFFETISRHHQVRSVLGVRLDGTAFTGWMMFFDRDDFTTDDLTLGEAIRHAVVAQIDAHLLAHLAQQSAVAGERVRLGQQLHDGLLQSMAGVVHYLEVVHKVLHDDPEAARRKITEVQALLMEDQRNLRMFLQQLAPPSFRSERDLSNQLHELAERLRRQWELRIELHVQSLDAFPTSLRGEIYNLASEALFNVVKHAEAQTVRLRVEAKDDAIHFLAEDDGRGFPFEGSYSLEQLEEMMSGPLSIRRRVAALGGKMVMETSSAGTSLRITLPLKVPSEEDVT